MSNSLSFNSARNSKVVLKKLSRALVFTLSLSIAVPVLSAPSAQAAPILTNYYQFEGNGTDSAGGQNANVVGSAGFSTGKYGNGYSSVGGNGSYVDMGQNVGLFGASDFTLGFWFQSPGGNGHLINKRLDSDHFITFQMSASGQIGLELRGGSGVDVFRNVVSAQSGLNNGAWHHFAVVRSGSTLNLYINGQVSATDNGADGLDFNAPNYNGANFIFGGTNAYPDLSFAGSLDDLKIYDGALSQSEVMASMGSNTPPPPPPTPTPSPSPSPTSTPSPSPSPTPTTSPSPSPSPDPLRDQVRLTVTASGTTYDATRTLTTTGGSTGGEVNFDLLSSFPEGACELVRNVVTFTGIVALDRAATCSVQATMAGDSTYYPRPSNKLAVDYVKPLPPRDQSPLTLIATGTSSDASRLLSTEGGSNQGLVTYNLVSANGPCSLVGDSVTFRGTATCEVSATMAGDIKYNPVTSEPISLEYVAPQQNQDELFITSLIGVPTIPLLLTTTGGSTRGAVSFRINPQGGNSAGCSLDALGTSIIATNAGTCMVTATMAGNAAFLDVSTFGTVITFRKVAQADMNIVQSSGFVNSPLLLTVSGGTGDGAVTFTVVGGNCTINGSSVLASTVGQCQIQAIKSGGDYYTDYEARTVITFAKRVQSEVNLADRSGTFGIAIPLVASGGTGSGTYSYEVISGTASGCSLTPSGLSVISSSAGTCGVIATNAEDAYFLARSSSMATMTFAKAAQVSLNLNNASGTFGNAIPLVINGGSGSGAMSFAVTNGTASGCSLTSGGNAIISSSGGTCFVIATKAGDSSFLASSSAQASFMFARAEQNSPVNLPDGGGVFGTSYLLVASGGTGTGAYSYVVTNGSADNCGLSGSGNTLVSSSAGTCFVVATKAGDNSYLPRSSTQATITINRAPQNPIFLTSLRAKVGTALPLTYIGGSGNGAVSFATNTTNWWRGCKVTNGSLTSRGIGECTVLVSIAGDRNYHPATSALTIVAFVAKP